MKKLDLNKMEKIGAKSCLTSSVALGLTFAGAFLVTGGAAAGLFAASFIWGSYDLGLSCG